MIEPAFVLPVSVNVIDVSTRKTHFRASIVSGDRVVWKCKCDRLHKTLESASLCGHKELLRRQKHSNQRRVIGEAHNVAMGKQGMTK